MRLFILFLCFYAATLIDTVVVPILFGTASSFVAAAMLVIGLALLDPWPAFGLALVAGFLNDIVGSLGVSHVTEALILFLIVQGFLHLLPWDEPAKRIGAVVLGLLAFPLAVYVGVKVGGWASGVYAPLGIHNFVTPSVIVTGALALGVFAFFELAGARQTRGRALRRL